MLQTSKVPKDGISEHIPQKQKLSDVSLSAEDGQPGEYPHIMPGKGKNSHLVFIFS